MSEAVQLAVVGVISSLLTGTLVVAVGVWAYRRQKLTDSQVKVEETSITELAAVRKEYREEIQELRREVRELRDQLTAKERENREQSVTIARQDARISDLEETVGELRAELAECVGAHHRKAI